MAPRSSRKRAADRSHEEPFNVAAFIDGARGTVDLDTVLENVQSEVRKQCVQIELETNTWAFEVQASFRSEMMRMPTKVRKMTVSQFCEKYKGSMDIFNKLESKNPSSKRLSAILPPKVEEVDHEEAHFMPGTVVKKKNSKESTCKGDDMTPWKQKRSHAGDMKTPMQPTRFDPMMMNTPAVRVPQKGESIAMVSMNGSPLGEYSSTKVAITKDAPTSISVEVDGMGFADLTNGLPAEWEAHQKKEVREKLENLQSQIATLMTSIGSE